MHIGDILKKKLEVQKLQKKRGTYFTDMVEEARSIINRERIGTKYKPLSFVAVRKKLSHLSDSDVAYFLSICKDAKNRKVTKPDGTVVPGSFSKVFFGALKVKT